MEINDVLTDPCPQCALKHLSAALFYAANMSSGEKIAPFADDVCAATALINIAEYRSGYKSHFGYIIGALVAAEEFDRADSERYRTARLSFVNGNIGHATNVLIGDGVPKCVMARAHAREAFRELPMLSAADGVAQCVVEALLYGDSVHKFIDAAQDAIMWVRENFFDNAQPAQTGGDTNDQG